MNEAVHGYLSYAGCGFVTMCLFACFVKVMSLAGTTGDEGDRYKLTFNRLSGDALLASLAAGMAWPFTLAAAALGAGVALASWLWRKVTNVMSKRRAWHPIDWLLTWPVNLWLLRKDKEANKIIVWVEA